MMRSLGGFCLVRRASDRALRWVCGACFLLAAFGQGIASRVNAEEPSELVQQAGRLAAQSKSEAAVELASKAIQADAKYGPAYYVRGREYFRLGKIAESVADFDRYVELAPDIAPRQWERGIALYYAGRFADGAKQFEDYQTFDSRDVENSVWRYLCMARDVGVAKARETMLPIENDRRIPMMDVYELYRGQRRPEQVLAAARAGEPNEQVLAGRLFYAHLYLGLFFEAAGDAEQARRYITLAADKKLGDHPLINRYMWDVARIHHQQLERQAAAPKGKP